MSRQVERWTRQYRASETEPRPAMEQLIAFLPGSVPPQERTGIVHGDYRLDNLMFAPERPEVAAVLDWELSTLGDPLADFVSLALLSDIRQDRAFLDGYRQAGGPVALDASSEVRLALYRSYLYLIMLAEVAPRTFTGAERKRREASVVPALATELGILRDRRPQPHRGLPLRAGGPSRRLGLDPVKCPSGIVARSGAGRCA